MLKLYVKDNINGHVHEYGTNPHDALVLQDDGSLHYYNLQNGCGTRFHDEGYSFCLEDGTIPQWDKGWGCYPYIDIGGEYYGKKQTVGGLTMDVREKLIELLNDFPVQMEWHNNDELADHLIANGVTVADNLSPTEPMTNCQKWIPVSERLPDNFFSVLGYMTDAGDFPPVRECYTVGNAFFFPELGDIHPVSHWMQLPKPPKEV